MFTCTHRRLSKKIVGQFTINKIIEDNPKKIWDSCKHFSGLDEASFFNYFDGREKGFAIEIKNVKWFGPIDPNVLLSDFHPPQSYCYVNIDLDIEVI